MKSEKKISVIVFFARYSVFLENLEKIKEHNGNPHKTWSMKVVSLFLMKEKAITLN